MIHYIGEPYSKEPYGGGIFVEILHGETFKTLYKTVYAHLSKVFVKMGQPIKRGELVGLSGASNNWYAHLHFGVCKMIGAASCINYSETYDPRKFWLGGKPQCFDPNMDYSSYSEQKITLPVACGEYAKELRARTKRKN